MLPRFEPAGRMRPVAVLQPGSNPGAPFAPYLAVEAPAAGVARLALASGDDRLTATYDENGYALSVTTAGSTTAHRSRRSGRPRARVDRVALTLTGRHLCVLGREGGRWVVRGRVDLEGRIDTRDEHWLAGVVAEGGEAGSFGQLGLRDLRLVTHADGTPVRDGDGVLLTATSAGPGFFDTGHTSVWRLVPDDLTLEHRGDLFFRRPDRPGVYGDHATHLLRDGGGWLVATSTWGDFDRNRPGASVEVTLAETEADLTSGRHVLDTRRLALPTEGFRSVGVWDPHLVRTDDGWLVTYVSATRFFRFHPVLAAGPELGRLRVRGVAVGHRETEGPTLARMGGEGAEWRVLASDGHRRRYPVLDLDLAEVGALDAPYPTNIPWPTLLEVDDGWLLLGFDGTPYGGRLAGYGTHGDVVVARSGQAVRSRGMSSGGTPPRPRR